MQRALLLVALVAFVACRAPGARVDPFAPAGAQRVPPPVTGSLGTPTPQPANPYYPSGLSSAPPTNTWQPAGPSAPGIAGLGTPSIAGSTSPSANANSNFGAAQPTAPAVIRNQAIPVNTGTFNNNLNTAPWQPSTSAPAPSGSFFNASAPSTNLTPSATPAAPPTTLPVAPHGGSIFNQPQSTFPVPVPVPAAPAAPATNFNGGTLPVNDATLAYPQPPAGNVPQPAWSFSGLRNWIQSQPWLTTQANPTFNTGATNVVYPSGVAVQPAGVQPAIAASPTGAVGTGVATPASGYSTVPASTTLPLRGMPSAVAPATWTTPAQSPTPASPTAANLSQPATVRGNLESEAKPGPFVATSQSSPTPHAAELYGHHEEYLWLRGQLEYSAIDKRWKLRYIPHDAAEGRMDNHGGSVVLIESEQMHQFESGDFVMVRGRLGEKSTASGYAPLYHVQQISPLD